MRRSANDTFRNDGIKVNDDGQKQMTTAYIAVLAGRQADRLAVSRRGGSSVGTKTRRPPKSAIRRGSGEDLYVVMPSNDPATMAGQTAPLQIVINPLVNWIWLGFGIIAFGTGIALLPERAFSFALAKMPVRRRGDHRRRCC